MQHSPEGDLPRSFNEPPSAAAAGADSHVLIIGAGVTGLLLAQAIRKRNQNNPPITFSIYERDADPLARGAGWGLTLHWALGQFKSLLPDYLIERLHEACVDQDLTARGELGNLKLFNLQTGQDDFMTPSSDSPRHRFARENLRRLLMDGLDIEWSKNLVEVQELDSDKVIAKFSDGTSAKGSILVGCDGSRSRVRRFLCPTNYTNNVVPVRLLGTTVLYPQEKYKKIQALDPYFFQCCDPVSDTFMFYGFLHVPTAKEQEAANGTLQATCQVLTSWPYKAGFFGKQEPSEVPETNAERVAWIKNITSSWIEPFRGIVQDIPEDAEPKVINLEDWPPRKGSWDNRGGRVTLIGDAAHAMTMYRGEAANHGVADVRVFLEQFLPENHHGASPPSLKEKVDTYELEMIERTRPAVLRSRKACMHAHDYKSVTSESPLIARRAIVEDKD
ncbi:hypothetical protein V493_04244 [Pseudogymnoascus sp. VKM F-4281 (FW-2241)]|nr:hypothetical protein V493_04244 [Pseudogymnoascus sp. VKM F-4281 (FW-2241)]